MKTSSVFIFLLFIYLNTFPQQTVNEFPVLFYNVENLFDLDDNPLTNDDEFTPEGERHWTYKRLNKKLNNLSKVILASSEWNTPAVVALCEVENRKVLELLINKTALKSIPYKIIHKESPDHRGIDVAFIYNEEQFYPLTYDHIPIKNRSDSTLKTREILHVSGIFNGTADTAHFFVNHWPSRYSGLMETRPLRKLAAQTLRSKIDELLQNNRLPKIVIIGDFNDQPNDESIRGELKAMRSDHKIKPDNLYNLSANWAESGMGTLKYQSQWYVFDQIIVSGALLQKNTLGLFTTPNQAEICDLPFLFENDERHGGMKLYRTYNGYQYNGGFSDHLPVILKLGLR